MKNYFIIHSVKGGCGKSAVSLFTGLLLSRKEENTIIVDCDLPASATHKLYDPSESGTTEIIKINDGSIKENALNEFLRGDIIDINDIINKIYFNWSGKGIEVNNKIINYIFAHSNNSKLSDFRFNIGANRANNISVGLFNNRFKELLNLIKSNPDYSNVIFDMAASSNEYSYIIYKQLLELKYDPKYDKKFLVIVTTQDTAHLEETTQYLKEIITGDTARQRFDNVIVIINSLANYDSSNSKSKSTDINIRSLDNCITHVNAVFDDNALTDCEFVKFIPLSFQEPYFILTHSPAMVALKDLNITNYLEELDKLIGGK